MNQTELDTLMQQCAEDAVKICQSEFKMELDYRCENISLVDEAIAKFRHTYQEQSLEDKAVFTLCNLFGAYLGETYKKQKAGLWVYDETDQSAPAVFLAVGENTYAFAGICYSKLVNDPSISIQDYFNQALSPL